MCVVRRLLVTIVLFETMIRTYKPFCIAWTGNRAFKCDCSANDGDTTRQRPANAYLPANPYSTVNYHGQSPVYYQLYNAQRLVPPSSTVTNYQTPPYNNYFRQQPNPSYHRPRPSSSIGPTDKSESYHFIYETENYRKEESADEDGNVRGYFEYEDDVGLHTLNYTCNDKTGFRITGGNLAPAFPDFLPPFRKQTGKHAVSATSKPPGSRRPINKEPASDKLDFPDSESAVPFSLTNLKLNLENLTTHLNQLLKTFYGAPKNERKTRPYSISLNSGSFEMEESSYSNGDARGYIQFDDVDGQHNLSYFRNEVIGFLVTGGNLAFRSPTYLPPRNYTLSPPGRINVTVLRDSDDDVSFVVGDAPAKPGE